MSLTDARTWDLVAPGYLAHNLDTFEAFAQAALDLVAVGADDRVLDVAAGPGALSLPAAARAASVDCIDFSGAMCDLLRQRAHGLSNLSVHQGDGQSLPFADDSFDAAFSLFGLMFFPDRARGLSELHRVLRPGGRAVVSSWVPMGDVRIFVAMFEALYAAAPQLAPTEPPPSPPLSTPALVTQELEAAGFRTSVHTVSRAVRAASMTAYLATVPASFAPLCRMREDMGAERFDALWAQVRPPVLAEFGDGPVEIEMEALFGVGQLM